MSNLNKEEIKSLIIGGWKCDDFPNLCPVASHINKIHYLLEDSCGDHSQEELAKNDDNYSGREGNSVVLHIGMVNARVSPQQNTEAILIIPPGRFAFFMTREIINMPLDCDGTLFMNPRVSNRGLLFFTLGHIDPGFCGKLTGTFLNTTSREITIEKKDDGVLYLVISRLDKPSKPHARTHEHPQIKMDEAIRDLSFSMNPGFALTTENFATKKDLENTRNLLIAIISISIAIFSIVVALLKLE